MMDETMSKQQIIFEINKLRQQLAELEGLEEPEADSIRVRKELIVSGKILSKAFQHIPDPVTISTLTDGRYVEINPAYEELTGYTRAEAIGKTALELGVWADYEDRNRMLKVLFEEGRVSAMETKFKSKWGEIFTFLLSVEVIFLSGEPYLLHLCKDITGLKDIEEALRISEESFSKAFNSSPIPMCISTFADGILIDVNERFCRITHSQRERIIGHTLEETGILVSIDKQKEIIAILAEHGSITEMEVEFSTASGKSRLGLFSAELLNINGEECTLFLFADQTERKQLELEILRLDRLNLIGEMAASIAHEIRNPMTTVRGYLQVLRYNEKFAQEVESFDLMIEELDAANSIITEYIALASTKKVELKPTNLNTLIKNIHPLLQANATIQDKAVILILNKLPDLMLDEKEISQLVFNLVKNGLEAIPPGRSVKIRTYLAGKKVVLAVQDDGHGIDPKILPELGMPFRTTKEQSVGLGLPVCYGIASRHHAKIDIKSNDQGTTVFVLFSR
ncbi:Signal transduction histidine kinase, core [Syntrophomonas zehnderi OL-4]|uniref:histidine kinase n=2 Tax=Syntrophomonas TaxID=862 RepID=A0A0E4GAT2_9FIRM|nr:Signal transduction histidine kinase, core [Syntrophomonas zehnderi OL-4]